jgi:hypothetical protein
LYCEVLGVDLQWVNNIGRPRQTKRIPAVLTKDEGLAFNADDGLNALQARLYGTASPLDALLSD